MPLVYLYNSDFVLLVFAYVVTQIILVFDVLIVGEGDCGTKLIVGHTLIQNAIYTTCVLVKLECVTLF